MTKTLNNESLPTASECQNLTVTTQSGPSSNTTKPLITLDCVIAELKRMKSGYQARGKLMEAKAMAKAVDNFRGMHE